MGLKNVALTALWLSISAAASAQSSKDFAVMASATWAAFECSTLASHLKDARESERLFTYGYQQGGAFISALKAKKIAEKDLDSEVPWIVLTLLQGPTPDFVLGRIYENAQEYTLKDILKSGDQLNPEDLQKTLTQSKFTAKNCRIVGPRK
jgi:hypothetical protein